MGVETIFGVLLIIVALGIVIALIRYLWPVALIALIGLLAWVGLQNLGN